MYAFVIILTLDTDERVTTEAEDERMENRRVA